MTDDFRRIVTAVDSDGHSIVDSDGPPPVVISPRHPEQFLTAIWTVGQLPTSYIAPGDRDSFRLSPPAGGVNIIRNKLPPDSVVYVDADGQPPPVTDEENLHRTATVDFICVLEGELWLILEGDEDVHLQAGDCVVQRGTVHAWRNRTDQATTFLAVLFDADEDTLAADPIGPKAL
ncbi:cupin domain-containing protein [Candidatus Poriferisocius sp.]|uniref:cupin domain-containing protein n=1 Tax=Candidatus Poriferisocius sp. TaxID=3101276 RepID=UPI003B521095